MLVYVCPTNFKNKQNMKKIILTIAVVMAATFANAQDKKSSGSDEGGFKLGVNVGLPMGDIKDTYSLTYGLDLAYLWPIADGFSAGVTSGFAQYAAKSEYKDFGGKDVSFVPVAATGQYSFSDNIFGGLDLGYAIAVAPSGADGGLLYQPKVGYQTEVIEVFLGYKGISANGGTASSLNLGFAYKF